MKKDIFKAIARFSDLLNEQVPLSNKELKVKYERQQGQVRTAAGWEDLVSGTLYLSNAVQ